MSKVVEYVQRNFVAVNGKLFKRVKDGFILVEPTLKKLSYDVSYIRALWISTYGPVSSKNVIADVVGDLKLSSLREFSKSEHKKTIRNINCKGYYKSSSGTFDSRVYIDGVKYFLGCFKTEEEAHKVYKDVVKQLSLLGSSKKDIIEYLNSKINYPLVINGESISLKEASIKYGVETEKIRNRVKAGWSLEQAVGLKEKLYKKVGENSKWAEIFNRKKQRAA